jgi:hypothetical protein
MRRRAAAAEAALSESGLDDVLLEARTDGVGWRELARALLKAEGRGASELELQRATAALARRLQRRATACRVFQTSPSRQQANAGAPCLGNTNHNKENDMKLIKRITTTEELFEVPDEKNETRQAETRPSEAQSAPVSQREAPLAETEFGEADTEGETEQNAQLEADPCCPPLHRARR